VVKAYYGGSVEMSEQDTRTDAIVKGMTDYNEAQADVAKVLEDAFFRFNKIDPDAPAERVALKDAIECLEVFGIGMAAEAKSTATAPLRTRQCEIRSTAIFSVLDILDQYRKALENFGVTFADNGFIRKIPRHDKEAGYRNALTEILTLRSRHAKDCHIVAREALKGASQ
jgi:hypothetical protein